MIELDVRKGCGQGNPNRNKHAQLPNPKMHKAFPRREFLISKGESLDFLYLQSVSGRAKTKKGEEARIEGWTNARSGTIDFFCFFVFLFEIFWWDVGLVSNCFNLGVEWFSTKPGFTVITYCITCILVRRPLALKHQLPLTFCPDCKPIILQFFSSWLKAQVCNIR